MLTSERATGVRGTVMDASMRSGGTSSSLGVTAVDIGAVDNELQLQQGEGTSSRLSGTRDSAELPDSPRNVKALAYDSGDVRGDVGSKKSLGRVKNWLADKLPFVGKTTYGNILQKADAYSAQAGNRTGPERASELKGLLADIAKWQNAHGTTSVKGQAIEQLRQSVGAALAAIAGPSRDDTMQVVEDYFDILCGRAPEPKSGKTAQQQPLSSNLIFRGSSDAAKALTTHLNMTAPESYKANLSRTAEQLTKNFDPGYRHVEIESDKGQPAGSLSHLEDKPFQAVLRMADPMMTALMGGKDEEGIQAAVDELPDEIIRTLGELDERVDADSNGDASTRKLAIVGTLFLRYATLAITEGVVLGVQKPTPQETGKRMLMATVQSALNNSPDDRQVTSSIHERHKEAYLDFVRSYQQPMTDFVDALLERAGRPPL